MSKQVEVEYWFICALGKKAQKVATPTEESKQTVLDFYDGRLFALPKQNYTEQEVLLRWLVTRTNRSWGQTNFLFQILNNDFEKLKELEEKIKNCFVYYCPADLEEVNKILNMPCRNEWFHLIPFA